ncbi:alpha/beta hydrolase [Mycobacterium conspicuum]|uniref:Esterase n=1 Tax=Mycobacterium conspicuum TaxID=44010 RepID=A0A1X1T655_9MYCO|nr:alpha/beta hydrolase [Mycobacterium conspicuum]ORV40043.1 esterase [Mycobacterium conspicuum]BBZ42504.1 esterase [Mycobacterium conspicuum]
MSLDPQLAPLVKDLDAGFPAVHTMTGAQAREVIRARFVPALQPEPVAEVRDQTIPGPGGDIPVRIYRPDGSTLPILVYAHGGGFVFCDLDSHDGLCRSFANRVPAIVVSVAYRLAPEHRWPAAADDFYAAIQWAADNAASLGGASDRIAVGGDSAGGNLAAVGALMARDRGGPSLAAQLLLYPVLAADFDNESYRLFGNGYYNPKPAMQWYWDQYVPTKADRVHPYAVPLHAELHDLPPAVVVIAGHDPLRDEALAYAAELDTAGVRVARVQFAGAIHGFMTMPSLGLAQEARRRASAELSWLLG